MAREVELSVQAARIVHFSLQRLAVETASDAEVASELADYLGYDPNKDSEDWPQFCRQIAKDVAAAFRPTYLIDVSLSQKTD